MAYVAFTAAVAMPAPARAMSDAVEHVIATALWGVAGGVVVGAASYAFFRNPRYIAAGGSLGLYTGAIIGGVQVWRHASGASPVRSKSQQPSAEPPPAAATPETPSAANGGAIVFSLSLARF